MALTGREDVRKPLTRGWVS